jgi:hypothetical protein
MKLIETMIKNGDSRGDIGHFSPGPDRIAIPDYIYG